MGTESCGNCRYSIEQWRLEGFEDEAVIEEFVGDDNGIDERNLFYCRKNPPMVNLGGYSLTFTAANEGLCIRDDRQFLGIFPLTRPDYWCGEWSSR